MPERSDNMQQYDIGLSLCVTSKCNLNCAYCISRKNEEKCGERPYVELRNMLGMLLLWNLIKRRWQERVRPIDIPRLMKTLDETGKIFRVNFTGGEPFLVPNIIEACVEITKKHFIALVTNLSMDNGDEFIERIDPGRVIFIIASLHIKELERHGLLSKYMDNFRKFQARGFVIFANEVAYPPLSRETERYKKFFKEKNIDLIFVPFAGQYAGRQYPGSYTDGELKAFNLDPSIRNRFDSRRKNCNAGYNTMVALPDGAVYPCYQLSRPHEKIGHIYKNILLRNKLRDCPLDVCECPPDIGDLYLYNKAMAGQIQDEALKVLS